MAVPVGLVFIEGIVPFANDVTAGRQGANVQGNIRLIHDSVDVDILERSMRRSIRIGLWNVGVNAGYMSFEYGDEEWPRRQHVHT